MATVTSIVATNQTQPLVVTSVPAASLGGNMNRAHQHKLKSLAITELVLGSICIIIGAAICGIVGTQPYSYSYYNGYRATTTYVYAFTTGEGIWCGVWIVVAGGLGIRAGTPLTTRCLVSTHMAFSIVASVFSGVMFFLSVSGAVGGAYLYSGVMFFLSVSGAVGGAYLYSGVMFYLSVSGAVGGAYLDHITGESRFVPIYSILCVVSFSSMVVLIISASYCCATLRCCGCYCPDSEQGNVAYAQPTAVGTQAVVYPQQTQVVYPQQPAMVYQGAPGVVQGQVALAQPMMQPGLQGTVQPNQGIVTSSAAPSEEVQYNAPPNYQAPV